jgi:hypothetical protein
MGAILPNISCPFNQIWACLKTHPELNQILSDLVEANGQRIDTWKAHRVMENVIRSIFAHEHSIKAQMELTKFITEVNNGRAPRLPLKVSDIEYAIRANCSLPLFILMWEYVNPRDDDVNGLFYIAATTNEKLALWMDARFPDEYIKERRSQHDVCGVDRMADERHFLRNIKQMSDKMAFVWFKRRLLYFSELPPEAQDKVRNGELLLHAV